MSVVKNLLLAVATASMAGIPAGFAHGGNHDEHAEHASRSAFQRIAGEYEAIRTALVADSLESVSDHARKIARRASRLEHAFDAEEAGVDEQHAGEVRALLPAIEKAAKELAAAGDLDSARAAFGALSESLISYGELVAGDKPVVASCPMVRRRWLQPEGEIGNPYLGKKMPRCGVVQEK